MLTGKKALNLTHAKVEQLTINENSLTRSDQSIQRHERADFGSRRSLDPHCKFKSSLLTLVIRWLTPARL